MTATVACIIGAIHIGFGARDFFHLASTNSINEPEIEKGRTIGDLEGARRELSELGKRERERLAKNHDNMPQKSPLEPSQVGEKPGGAIPPRPLQSVPVVGPSQPVDGRPETLAWGMLDLPESERTQHFLVAGSVGSGKTLTIQMLMRSAMGRMEPGLGSRVLVLDAKREYRSYIAGICPGRTIRTLDPFDIRGVAWDLAADITSSAEADQLVQLLIPRGTNESQPYFSDAARDLAKATVEALQKLRPLKWTLRDLLLLTEDPDRLRTFLEKVPAVMDRARRHFDANEFPSVMSTLATKLSPLSVVAALWEKAPERFGLNQWMAECSILMLASDPVHRESLEPINRAIFARAANLLLSQSEKNAHRTWVFLDEVREAGKLDGLRSLLNLGRSKGVGVVLGFQDFDGMKAQYGSEEAHEITGQCNNKTFLRTDSIATAQWMESNAGNVLVMDSQFTFDPNSPTMPKSTSQNRTVRQAVLASEFMQISRTTPENGLRAFHLNPLIGKAYWSTSMFSDVLSKVGEAHPGVPNFIKRPVEFQGLEPWSPFDAIALDIPFTSKPEVRPERSLPLPTEPDPQSTVTAPSGQKSEHAAPRQSKKATVDASSHARTDALTRLKSVKHPRTEGGPLQEED